MIFISYNRADQWLIESLACSLHELQVEAWLDVFSLSPGVIAQQQILEKLYCAEFFLLSIGPFGLGPWQTFELDHLAGRQTDGNGPHTAILKLPGSMSGQISENSIHAEACFTLFSEAQIAEVSSEIYKWVAGFLRGSAMSPN